MCLAVPAKIIDLHGKIAKVDFGGGVQRDVNVSLVDAKIGDYVIVHAGFAIQILDEKEALETLEIFNKILEESS
jgi:hydrogenase expression/formation protein HypC